MSISKEKKLSPMFECWTADRVWISFLFLTTWKLSHLIKTKFVENEKRVLKKKTSKKKRKEKKKKKKKKRKLVSDEIWTCAFGGKKKKGKNTVILHSATPASAENPSLKQVHIPSLKWLTVFRNKFLGFLYNYGIFNWTSLDKKLKIKSSSLEGVDWTW